MVAFDIAVTRNLGGTGSPFCAPLYSVGSTAKSLTALSTPKSKLKLNEQGSSTTHVAWRGPTRTFMDLTNMGSSGITTDSKVTNASVRTYFWWAGRMLRVFQYFLAFVFSSFLILYPILLDLEHSWVPCLPSSVVLMCYNNVE